MELTGKAKEDFEKWYTPIEFNPEYIDTCMDCGSIINLYAFYQLPNSMKFGVYKDFFKSVNVVVIIYEADIEKACEIYNERNR